MDFQSAVQYVAAILVIIVAGALLGMALRSRQEKRSPLTYGYYTQKATVYGELIHLMDALSSASPEHKAEFVRRYYQALLHAPDNVIIWLNRFLATITDNKTEEEVMDARAQAILAMRQDLLRFLKEETHLSPADLNSIEVKE